MNRPLLRGLYYGLVLSLPLWALLYLVTDVVIQLSRGWSK